MICIKEHDLYQGTWCVFIIGVTFCWFYIYGFNFHPRSYCSLASGQVLIVFLQEEGRESILCNFLMRFVCKTGRKYFQSRIWKQKFFFKVLFIYTKVKNVTYVKVTSKKSTFNFTSVKLFLLCKQRTTKQEMFPEYWLFIAFNYSLFLQTISCIFHKMCSY